MTGIIVLCRYNSSRLPGKILKKINGKPILEYIIERLDGLKKHYPFVICTSLEKTDEPIITYCKNNNIDYYRGPLDNVALRFLDCAKKKGFDNAVRINGDNLFLDTSLILTLIEKIESKQLDFISNVKDRTYPKGMSIEIVNLKFYEKSYPLFKPEDLEHVMTYFYRGDLDNIEYVYNPKKMNSTVNLAIDTQEDFENAQLILDYMQENHTTYDYNDIINIYSKIG
ncbi:cytidylyltransferase domain-containing protein [Maribacter sp. CXY002]|uniref:cytidylyltransferase domain-containing protein n=1 Tax=Maribacter luteocoastalis TaxID=3407671 RepID=UPI003B67135E